MAEEATVRDYADTFGIQLFWGEYDPTKDYATQTDPANRIAGIDDFPTGAGQSVEKYAFVRQDQEDKDETVLPKAIRLRELALTLGFNADRAVAIEAIVGKIKFLKITLPGGHKVVFPGYISDFNFDHAKQGEVLHPAKIQPHKKPKFVKYVAP